MSLQTSLDPSRPTQYEWTLGQPWFWVFGGLLASGLAWLWTQVLGDDLRALRYTLILAGLTMSAVGIAIRLNSQQPAYLNSTGPALRRLLLGVLGCVFGLVAFAMSAWLLCSFFQLFSFADRWGPLLVWWAIVAPLTGTAAVRCFARRATAEPLSVSEESAALLLLAAIACYLASWALLLPADPGQMDTMRTFLGVLTVVPFIGAALMMASVDARRNVISLVILLHFGGIASATLAAPPASWVISQLWTRIYRPYLEFMYLNNAYHFYAPEPGPATYLWFRILYEDADGQPLGRWYKIPQVDEHGYQQHAVGLSYQRHLALTEVFAGGDLPTFFYEIDDRGFPKVGPNGNFVSANFYVRRVFNSPIGLQTKTPLGVEKPKITQIIPFHPQATQAQQYKLPTPQVKEMMKSYALHVMDMARKQDPELKVTGVKIYRVIHPFANQEAFLEGADPNAPDTYLPFFYGEYDTYGELADPLDPFLYWLVPVLRVFPTEPDSPILSYARKHAGDPNWVRNRIGEWVDEVPAGSTPGEGPVMNPLQMNNGNNVIGAAGAANGAANGAPIGAGNGAANGGANGAGGLPGNKQLGGGQ